MSSGSLSLATARLTSSGADDPRIQAQFSNQATTVYYSDNITGKPWKFSSRPMPSSIGGDWDKFAVLDEDSVAGNYVSVNTDRDFIAKITDNGAVVAYKDAAVDLLFRQRPLPAGVDKMWDTYFTTDDDRYGLFRSQAVGAYRFGYVDAKTGKLLSFDFQPLSWGLQSSRYGIYRGIGYHLVLREWMVIDFLPTQKLICFDLARAYDVVADCHKLSPTGRWLTKSSLLRRPVCWKCVAMTAPRDSNY